jgi:hypothetical protein
MEISEAYFNILSRQSPEGTSESLREPQDSRCLDRVSTHAPPQYNIVFEHPVALMYHSFSNFLPNATQNRSQSLLYFKMSLKSH